MSCGASEKPRSVRVLLREEALGHLDVEVDGDRDGQHRDARHEEIVLEHPAQRAVVGLRMHRRRVPRRGTGGRARGPSPSARRREAIIGVSVSETSAGHGDGDAQGHRELAEEPADQAAMSKMN